MSLEKDLKIIFAGTPEFAAAHLRALIEHRYNLVAVYTQPDRPAGRGKKLHASPVKNTAEQAKLSVFQPQSLRDENAQSELASLNADLMIVVAYGLILPQKVLDTPRLGCINVHGSILPRWRGAAPIQRAIEAGDQETGITIMQMEAGLDTGPMLLKKQCPITIGDTSAVLHDRLIDVGCNALLEALPLIAANKVVAEQQDDSLATYAQKISKEEALIDWLSEADMLVQKIHALNPFPTAYTLLNGERLRILEVRAISEATDTEAGTIVQATPEGINVACSDGQICVQKLQLPGKKPMDARSALNGFAELLRVGQVLGR